MSLISDSLGDAFKIFLTFCFVLIFVIVFLLLIFLIIIPKIPWDKIITKMFGG